MPSIDWDQQMLRAPLFVPGNDRRKLARLAQLGLT
jgi:hypothetical protein